MQYLTLCRALAKLRILIDALRLVKAQRLLRSTSPPILSFLRDRRKIGSQSIFCNVILNSPLCSRFFLIG